MADNSTMMKLVKLKEILKDMGSVLVGLSGGVDSTFLLKVASDTLGMRAAAATAVSYIYPSWETREAAEIAASFGVEYVKLTFDPIKEVRNFANNPKDRCYICKKAVFSRLIEQAEAMGLSYVVDGTNADDLNDYRPGLKAVEELGIKSPLLMAGLTKLEIRELSKEMGLPTHNKPAFACLATRIPYDDAISQKKLKMIDSAESFILSRGIRNVRVRCHEDLARIEVDREEMPKFFELGFMNDIDRKLKEFGFKYTSLDLSGYKTGSMNVGVKNE